MKRLLAFGLVLAFLWALAVTLPAMANPDFDCANVSEIPKIECKALVTLYNSTDGLNWYDHDNWLVTNTPSDWYGVGVDTGHVITLELSSNQLSGTIPATLSDLGSLQGLELMSNQLSGAIPPELGNLSNLVQL